MPKIKPKTNTQKKKTWPKRLPTKKQREFIEEYIKTGNWTKAANKAYNPNNNKTAAAIASENLNKPYLQAEIDKRLQDAKDMIYKLSQGSEKDEVKLRASQDIVDRVEGKATQKIETSGELKLDLDNASISDLLNVIKKGL